MEQKYIEKISFISPFSSSNDKQRFQGFGTLLVAKDNRPETVVIDLAIFLFMLDCNKDYNLVVTSSINNKEFNVASSKPNDFEKKIFIGEYFNSSFSPEISITDFPLGIYEFRADLYLSNTIIHTNECYIVIGEVDQIDTYTY